MRIDLKNILSSFAPEKDDISLFLTMLERQMKPLDFWAPHLIRILSNDTYKLVAREDEEMFKNYCHILNILLN